MFTPRPALPFWVENFIRKFSRALVEVPAELDLKNIEDHVIAGCRRMIFEFPALYRIGFFFSVFLFEISTWLTCFSFKIFSQLQPPRSHEFVQKMGAHRLVIFRELFQALRSLTLMVYCSDPRIWKYIGYDPVPHLQERIELRKEVLKRA